MAQRELKFRGQRCSTKEMVYGQLRYATGKYKGKAYIFNEQGLFEVIPGTEGQYIGLNSKEKKEIYEGDILKFIYFPLGVNHDIIEYYKIAVVVSEYNYFGAMYKVEATTILDKGRAQYYHKTEKKKYVHPTLGENWIDKSVRVFLQSVVIGNIYENPELIQE